MIAAIRAFIKTYEMWFGIALFVFFFGAGIYTCHIFNEAADTEQIKADAAKYKSLADFYHAASDGYQKLNSTLKKDNQDLLDKGNETTDPNCDNKPISPQRLQLRNSLHRPTAA